MGYIFDQSGSINPLFERVNADGTIETFVTADVSCTASYPKALFATYDGFHAVAVASSLMGAMASGTNMSPNTVKIGVMRAGFAIASGSEGWIQTGGLVTTTFATATTLATGNKVDVSGGSLVLGVTTATNGMQNTFGVAGPAGAGSSTTHVLNLWNNFVVPYE